MNVKGIIYFVIISYINNYVFNLAAALKEIPGKSFTNALPY